MRNNKFLYAFLIMITTWFSINIAFAQSDPVQMLQSVADHMIAGLQANKATLKSKPQIVFQLANKYVVPHADVAAMAKRVLPPNIWNSATPSERAQFQKEFTTTLIRTYASALTSYQDQVVKFFPVRGGSRGTVEVNSEIQSSQNSPIRVSYRLIQSNGSWKLYDLSVEGVSMLESFRSQFSDILSQGNMQDLLQRMSGHNRGPRRG